tara:strand:+ start:322 stop:516 length:195 start_codon:yes stop_codon:yes gene_type:complete
MICYRDRTYCVSPDCTNECGRKLTPEIRKEADKWWGKGPGSAPIAISCFCGGDIKDIVDGKTKQ